MVKAAAPQRVATFDEVNTANDPHAEHDFLSFPLCGRTFFFKIDYYDQDIRMHSEDLADPQKTCRVGTLMLAESLALSHASSLNNKRALGTYQPASRSCRSVTHRKSCPPTEKICRKDSFST